VFSATTHADNVALPAARRAAARLLLTAGRAALDQYLLTAGIHQQTRRGGGRQPDGTDRRQTVA